MGYILILKILHNLKIIWGTYCWIVFILQTEHQSLEGLSNLFKVKEIGIGILS